MELNEVLIIGGSVRDAETRQGGNGLDITKIRLAVKAQKRNATKEDTNYFNVTFFGTTAKNAATLIKKGTQVLIKGRLEMNEYTDKNGQRRETVEIVAESFKLQSSRKPAATSSAPAPEAEALPV